MKVLLINGTERTPLALKGAIEQNGHEIIEAADCRDAALKIRADRPDLVLLAGRLSDSDRSLLTAELKKDPASIEIPIISCDMEADGVDGFDLGLTIETMRCVKGVKGPVGCWAEVVSMLERLRDVDLEKSLARAKAELSLLQFLSQSIDTADDLKTALTAALEGFCMFDPCVYSEAWLLTPAGVALEAHSSCGGKSPALEEFSRLGRGLALKTGNGLPGMGFSSKKPVLIGDISEEDSTIIRAQAACAAGLKAVVCAPVIDNNETIAVLLFFMSRSGERAESLFSTIRTAAAQLGPVIRHKMAVEEKNRQMRKYEDIINNINVGIFRASHEGVITEANPAFVSIFSGASRFDVISRPFSDFFIDKSLQGRLREKLTEKGFFKDEIVEMSTLKGQRFLAALSAFSSVEPDGESCCNGVIEDITEKKRMEDHLRQLLKIDAVGRLSGGIAHEFNNILAAIIGYGNLLLIKRPDDLLTKEYTRHILSLSERAAKLRRGILAFSRRQVLNLKATDISEVIGKAAAEIEKQAGISIAVKTALDTDPVQVFIDEPQIMDVFRTLASNSIDAMPGGGTITIAATAITLDEGFSRLHGHNQTGSYALVSFSDTGTGMDEATRKNAFDPFFTTKEVNKGTGLGLSMAYGIIKQHNGFIDIQSEPDTGTAVMIYLPLAAHPGKTAGSGSEYPLITGSETVLLAEDQAELRVVTSALIKEFGYTVIEAKDGREAVELFKRHKGEVRLLILDLIMPEMGGASAYYEISRTDPSVEVIFMSGYPTESQPEKGPDGKRLNFIRKPFMPGELLSLMRALLDKPDKRDSGL